MPYDLEDKINIIYLKKQLINLPPAKLKKIYREYDAFGFFIDTLNISLDSDPSFFLIDDRLLPAVEDVLNDKRFDYKNQTYTEIINEIIRKINLLKSLPEREKRCQKEIYFLSQQELRGVNSVSQEDFLSCLAYDAVLIDKLARGDLSIINEIYFYQSTNYLVHELPEYYQEDPKRIDLTFQKLGELSNQKGLFKFMRRRFARDAISNLQMVKHKEE